MLCPKCQISLTVTKRFSIEVNDCPQCHGIWLEKNVLEKIMEQIQLAESSDSEQSLTKSKTTQDRVAQDLQNKKRKHPHFLSGAFDVYDDW